MATSGWIKGGSQFRKWVDSILLWMLFFLIAFGLGHSMLNRFDPRTLGPDWQSYYSIVKNQDNPSDVPFCFRVLVPLIARPFYLLLLGRSRSWDPVCFGLLISNCLFSASAALILFRVSVRVLGNRAVALLASSLFLMNYVVCQLWLSGMVDSSEAFLLLAATWALLSNRWWLLPPIGVLGGMAKESFLVFSVFFAASWWLALPKYEKRLSQTLWAVLLGITTTATIIFVHLRISGHAITPVAMTAWWSAEGKLGLNILNEFTDQEFWYAFAWLLPLGCLRLNALPKPWVVASIATGVLAICLGGYAQSFGGVCRPLFSIIGPVFSLSAANFLARGWDRPTDLPS